RPTLNNKENMILNQLFDYYYKKNFKDKSIDLKKVDVGALVVMAFALMDVKEDLKPLQRINLEHLPTGHLRIHMTRNYNTVFYKDYAVLCKLYYKEYGSSNDVILKALGYVYNLIAYWETFHKSKIKMLDVNLLMKMAFSSSLTINNINF